MTAPVVAAPRPDNSRPFRVLRTLYAQGFTCEVFAALDAGDHEVALKIVNRKKLQSARDLERVRREAALLASFAHPNVVELLEFLEDERQLCLVLPLAPDGDLAAFVECRTLSEEATRNAALQIFRGLAYVHSHGVVVVDVKPHNILVFGQRLKLCDLGLAEILHHRDSNSGALDFTGLRGSAGFFSPEQLRGEGTYDAKIDVYAAGVTAFRLLAGYDPVFPSSNARHLTPFGPEQVDFSGEIWKFVSAEMIDFLRLTLAGTACTRLSSTQALTHAWINLKNFPLVSKYPDPPPDLTIHFSAS